MKKWLIVLLFLLTSVSAFSLPNPASVYCSHHKGRLKMMSGSFGVIGVCVFRDRSYCEEWSYIKGICKLSQFYLPEKRWGTKYCLAQLPNKNLIIYLCKA